MDFKELTPAAALGEMDIEIPALEVSTIVSLPGPVILALSYKRKHFPQGGLNSIDTGKNGGPMFGVMRRVFAIHDDLKSVANLVVQLGDPAEIVLHLVMAVLGSGQYEQCKESCKAAQNHRVGEYGSLHVRSCYGEMNHLLQDAGGEAK